MPRPIPASIPTSDLKRLANGWLLDCQYRNLSACTIQLRRSTVDKLLWWLERGDITSCGPLEVKGFMTYLRNGHLEPEGRFGNPQSCKPLATRSLKDWHINLATFFRFLVTEGYVDVSPMEGLRPPIHRPNQVQPFTEEQVQSLLRAARKSKNSPRPEAVTPSFPGYVAPAG